MRFLKRLLGLKEPLTPEQKAVQAEFVREERAAQVWARDYDREGESQDNVANVANHQLLLSILDEYNVTRQGFLNGYFRVYGAVPYYFHEDDFIGEE
jgi:hypothetical protein